MQQFESYETVRELHRTGLTALLSARRAGDLGDPTLAIKSIQPSAVILGSRMAARNEVERFLNQARVQQAVAAAGGTHWAPVHELREAEDGAYYVTDRYKRSVRQLVLSRVSVNEALLHHIIASVVKGLRELREAADRAHGNLKPTNVLLGDAPDLVSSPVYLTDPRDSVTANPDEATASDLRAVGDLIHQLVTHESAGTNVGWSAAASPRWQRLGPRGEQWRALCNRLLDFDPASRISTLDALEEAVEQLQPKPTKRLMHWIAGGAAAVIVVTILAIFLMPGAVEPEETVDDEQQRQALAVKLHNWAHLLSKDHAQHDGFVALVQRDPDLKLLAEKARQVPAGLGLDGRGGGRGLRAALDTVSEIEAELQQWIQQQIELSDSFRQRGWDGPAEVISQRVASLSELLESQQQLDRRGDGFFERLGSTMTQLEQIRHIDQQWDQVSAAAERIAQTDVALLAAFPQFASMTAHDTFAEHWPVTESETAADLSSLLDLAEQLKAFLDEQWDELNRELVHRDPPVTLDEGVTPEDVHFQRWLQGVQAACYRRADPRRQDWSEDELLQPIVDRLEQLRERGGEPDSMLVEDIEHLREEIVRLSELPWMCANQNAIIAGVNGVMASRPRLENRLEQAIAYLSEEAEEFIARLPREVSPSGSAAIDQVWQERVDALRQRDVSLLEARREVDAVRDVLRMVEESFVLDLAGTSEDDAWHDQLVTAVRQQREQALAEAIGTIEWTQAVLAGDPLPVMPARDRAVERYAHWRGTVSELVGHFVAVQSLLNNCYAIEERDRDGRSIRQVYQQCLDLDVYREAPEIRAAFAPIVDRIQALQAVDEMDVSQLAERAGNPGRTPEAAFAAWRRLGDETLSWPTTFEQLDRERRIQAALRATIATRISEATRKQSLERELSQGGFDRWQQLAISMSSTSDVERAIALRSEFDEADDDDRLLTPLRINIALHGFVQDVQQLGDTVDNDAIGPVMEVIYSNVQSLRGELPIGDDGQLEALLIELRALMEALDEPGVDFSAVGPGRLGWLADVSDDGTIVRFSPPDEGEWAIAFRLVEASDAMAYVSTSEVSLGTFNRALDAAGQWQQIVALMPDVSRRPQELRDRGPRVWHWDENHLAPWNEWTYQQPGAVQDDLYAEGLDITRPTLNHPMQHVTPAAAMYVAGLLGARLPTSDEWLAAVEQVGLDQALQAANLRDVTWQRQYQHIFESRRAFEGRPLPPGLRYEWPDARVFLIDDYLSAEGGREAIWQFDGGEPVNDGVLWFRETDAGGSEFADLVGNVSEFVFEAPQAFDERFTDGDDLNADSIRSFLQEQHTADSSRLFVIGGSSLSHPAMAVDQTHEVAIDEMFVNFRQRSYADVGFRLAFSVDGVIGGGRLRDRLVDLLRDRYILASAE